MSEVSRHRLRWWLRGERALGLRYVYAPGAGMADVAAAAVPHDASHDRAAELAVPPAPVVARSAPRPPAVAVPVRETRSSDPANFPILPTFDHNLVASGSDSVGPLAADAGPGLPGIVTAEAEPFASAELSPDDKAAALRELDERHVKGCVKCPLSRTRRNTVFGEGNPAADLMFVGEGPGGTEDASGRPFVGKSGQKLDEMIRAMGLTRDDVFIANVVKCRAFLAGPPPKDRPPQPDEAAACMPYLQRQIEVVRPKVIVTLGLSATQYLLGVKQSMSRMRGRWHGWRGVPVMPTFHPSYILRNYTPETRRAVWDDLRQVMDKLGIVPPSRRG